MLGINHEIFNSQTLATCTHIQKDEGKLEGLLKEVAETEVPADAPQPPPEEPDQDDGNGDDQMLPSQRGKTGKSGLLKGPEYNTVCRIRMH